MFWAFFEIPVIVPLEPHASHTIVTVHGRGKGGSDQEPRKSDSARLASAGSVPYDTALAQHTVTAGIGCKMIHIDDRNLSNEGNASTSFTSCSRLDPASIAAGK